jgi:cytoskeletal protein RodZ
MKRCLQCEFVYEDEQSVCDMDGSELVHEAESLPLPPLVSIASEPAALTAKSAPGNFAVPAFAGIILAALLFIAYYATTHTPQRPNANQAIANATLPQATPDLNPGPSPETVAAEPIAEITTPESTPPETKPAPIARLNSGPVVVASSPEHDRGAVIIRLTNGATIRADDAWQKREGIWYRQNGLVTFLKRSRVRTIERPAPVRPAPLKPAEKKTKPEAADKKKESRVTSILKTTGRILKRPFKF